MTTSDNNDDLEMTAPLELVAQQLDVVPGMKDVLALSDEAYSVILQFGEVCVMAGMSEATETILRRLNAVIP